MVLALGIIVWMAMGVTTYAIEHRDDRWWRIMALIGYAIGGAIVLLEMLREKFEYTSFANPFHHRHKTDKG